MKNFYNEFKIIVLLTIITILSSNRLAYSQIPKPALVGYWQNWSNNLKLTAINDNYNVIQIAFATTVGTSLSNMTFTLPSNYNPTTFKADIDALHAKGKVVILSIGGASDPVRLDDIKARDEFVNTINTILANYSYKFDGIDIDFETTSMAFGSTWTMDAPAAGQTNLIDAIKSIMQNYKTQTGKKMLLTMAPETIYLMGALSSSQMNNYNGGAMLPIIQTLSDELDLLHCQYYNAGGAGGGTYAINGGVYHDNSDPDYITSMTESIIYGFTLQNGKGLYNGLPESKVAIGLPAKSNTCGGTGTGYNTPDDVCTAVKYLQGKISKPSTWGYELMDSYPDLAGLMTWSINIDYATCGGSYSFANSFNCAFPKTETAIEDVLPSADGIKIYPNPTSGILNITFEKSVITTTKLRVLNSIGMEVYSSFLAEGQNNQQIDLSGFTSGLYLLEYVAGGKNVTKRVIIK